MTDHPLLQASALELARRIRTQEVSSRDVVESHIARARAVNPLINAIVADRYDEALREAEAADAAIHERRELGRLELLSVPRVRREDPLLVAGNDVGLRARCSAAG